MDIVREPNPFEQLDKDFPQFAMSRAASPVKSAQPSGHSGTSDHSDLNDVCSFYDYVASSVCLIPLLCLEIARHIEEYKLF